MGIRIICVALPLLGGCMSAEQFAIRQDMLKAQHNRMYEVGLRREAIEKKELELWREQQQAKLAEIREQGELEQTLMKEQISC